jgi:hypothetical protein
MRINHIYRIICALIVGCELMHYEEEDDWEEEEEYDPWSEDE